jgi:HAE1 family hydrophobic/amphiphilic exporter-1
VIASTWPIYGWVKQEYTPTDVDESEFEATINGPEGISMPAMDEAVRAIAAEIGAVPGVRNVLITAGGGFLGRISQGNIYVRTTPHDERTFGLARLWPALHGIPGRSRNFPSAT